jgi:hypothetical protein
LGPGPFAEDGDAKFGTLVFSANGSAHRPRRYGRARLAVRELPLRRDVMDSVDEMILQTPGKIWRGQPVDVDAAWAPATTRVYAKTGSMDRDDGNVRWLVGHVTHEGRAWAFASLVTSHGELSAEAVTEGVHELRAAGLLKQKSTAP